MEGLLPARLSALLALEADGQFADRLRMVDEAAARAIGKLGELDLLKYDDSPIDGSADLSLWEEVAPVVGSTIADVNALLQEIHAQFPPGELAVDPRQASVDGVIQAASGELRQDVTDFGGRVRDPSVVGDRWNLIAELQTFRSRFRDRIGSMVFETATSLGECRRHEVDPGYEDALATTLVVRSTTADLRRLMHSRIHKVAEANAEDVEWNGQQVEKELNAFGRTAAWRVLRAQDKKVILEFRQSMRAMVEKGGMQKLDLLQLLEPFVEFIDAFEHVNRREILMHHDQELAAQIGVVLERAVNASAPEEKHAAFVEAVGMAQALYGRSKDIDAFIRKVRRTVPNAEALQGDLEEFLMLLANLMQF